MDKTAIDLQPASEEEMRQIAAISLKASEDKVELAGKTDCLSVFVHHAEKKRIFGLLTARIPCYRVLDQYGVVKLQVNDGLLFKTTAGRSLDQISAFIEKSAAYNDVGMMMPEVFVLYKSRVADYSSVLSLESLKELLDIELQGLDEREAVLCLLHIRK